MSEHQTSVIQNVAVVSEFNFIASVPVSMDYLFTGIGIMVLEVILYRPQLNSLLNFCRNLSHDHLSVKWGGVVQKAGRQKLYCYDMRESDVIGI